MIFPSLKQSKPREINSHMSTILRINQLRTKTKDDISRIIMLYWLLPLPRGGKLSSSFGLCGCVIHKDGGKSCMCWEENGKEEAYVSFVSQKTMSIEHTRPFSNIFWHLKGERTFAFRLYCVHAAITRSIFTYLISRTRGEQLHGVLLQLAK